MSFVQRLHEDSMYADARTTHMSHLRDVYTMYVTSRTETGEEMVLAQFDNNQ